MDGLHPKEIDVPDDVIFHILSFFHGSTILPLACVSKSWHRFLSTKKFWQRMLVQLPTRIDVNKMELWMVRSESYLPWKLEYIRCSRAFDQCCSLCGQVFSASRQRLEGLSGRLEYLTICLECRVRLVGSAEWLQTNQKIPKHIMKRLHPGTLGPDGSLYVVSDADFFTDGRKWESVAEQKKAFQQLVPTQIASMVFIFLLAIGAICIWATMHYLGDTVTTLCQVQECTILPSGATSTLLEFEWRGSPYTGAYEQSASDADGLCKYYPGESTECWFSKRDPSGSINLSHDTRGLAIYISVMIAVLFMGSCLVLLVSFWCLDFKKLQRYITLRGKVQEQRKWKGIFSV